jgi:hypothetical protein
MRARALLCAVMIVAAAQCIQAAVLDQGTKLVGTGGVGQSLQGSAVALSSGGDTLFVGAFGDSGGLGASWVFVKTGNIWSQQGPKLVGSGSTGTFVQQGVDVGLASDGNTAIVGGNADNFTSSGVGAAWIFVRVGGVWSQQGGKLVGTGAIGPAGQGVSVALSGDGNTAIVGGQADNSGVGAAWMFVRTGNVWTQQAKLVGTGFSGFSFQGFAVALSGDGNTAAVGGYGDNGNRGAVWVFTRSGGTWTQDGAKLIGAGGVGLSQMGVSVGISNDASTIVAGGNQDISTGAIWIFTRSSAGWTTQKLVGSGNTGGASQGFSVSIAGDGRSVIEGGPQDNNGAGAAWLFELQQGQWVQRGSKIVGAGAIGAANQGISVALSGDGSTAAVGGYLDNNNAGAVWAFGDPALLPAFSPLLRALLFCALSVGALVALRARSV